MRLLSTHEAGRPGSAPPAPCYSLGLPAWARPTTDGLPSGSRSARTPDLTQRVLQHLRHHPTGAGR